MLGKIKVAADKAKEKADRVRAIESVLGNAQLKYSKAYAKVVEEVIKYQMWKNKVQKFLKRGRYRNNESGGSRLPAIP